MTCRDCIHYERCHSEIAYGMGSDDLTGKYYTDIETRCKGFKNKANYVEVVRCKDCEHLSKKGICEKFRQRYPFFPDDYFYCGFGKRKEGAEE